MTTRLAARLFRCRKGATAVEFAVAAPILLAALVVLADFGLAVNEKMRLESAAQAGALYGYKDSGDLAAVAQAVRDGAGLDAAKVAVSATKTCGCADGTAVACDAACGDGSARRSYVNVTVTETWTPMLKVAGISDLFSLSGSASLRVD